MKKMLKKLLKSTIVVILLFIVVFMFLLSDWNSLYKREEFVFLKEEIQKTKSGDFSNIPELYSKIYSVKSIKNYYFKSNSSSDVRCPCLNAMRYNYGSRSISSNRLRYLIEEVLFTLKLEQEFSQEDCLKLLLKHSDFLNENKGVKEASIYYFDKPLNSLNLDEKLTLILMYENASLYNPRRRPELIKERVEQYKKQLNQ